eukprot:gnl/MRDRNA2_/MRDRNA2_108171_c0_seq1.p1 gnl/MRDRNA2_/MRDRNA2_108171_c0~~gnl/MRDRNA2_/MRDRNA2_108171_c0_seq1.p1  ORF type:complete len:122 (+),score=18.54 gnl/MRDRNA2_/MRDRNA2_108171_c0_seq1:71-436(+)
MVKAPCNAVLALALLPTGFAGLLRQMPPCDGVQCGNIDCPAPLQVKQPGTCCPICQDSDNAIQIKRKSAFDRFNPESTSRYCQMTHCPPPTCLTPGQKVVLKEGRCCKTCDPPSSPEMLTT